VEIRFGQGAYPGKGSYLPAGKITAEVAEIRGLKKGEAAYSPAHHPDINNSEELGEKNNLVKGTHQWNFNRCQNWLWSC
jgi:glutamate synthase domain-containing protein 2